MKVALFVAVLLLLSGCKSRNDVKDEFAKIGCRYTHTEELEERVYCGKACSRPLERMWFKCESGSQAWQDY